MEENKDLTPEDKVRIEQEAAKLFNRWDGGLVNVQTMLLSIAEYATLYERQQCDKIIERATADGMDTIVMLDQKVKQLEAERSEVTNLLTRLVQSYDNSGFEKFEPWYTAKEYLDSLKTK